MSHHLDSPIARQDPRLDITDLYVFRGEQGTVLVTNHSHSLAGEDIPRGLHPEGKYEFKIDGNGDAIEEVTYRFTFGETEGDGTQPYEVRRLAGAEARDAFGGGVVLAQGRTGQVVEFESGRAWAGKAGDPFWIEPDVLHAVGAAFEAGTRIELGEWTPDLATNLFAGHTVYSLVLELIDEELAPIAGPDRRIGVWGLVSLATDAGGWRQINRAGLPMIHPLFTQLDEHLGDHLNESHPSEDRETYGKVITDKVAGVVRAYGNAEHAEAYGRTVAERFLPNILRYTVGTPASFGFAAWNGRSLIDNAPDAMFSFAANRAVTLAIGKESITSKPRATFPYVPTA
ncbi:DUF4331 family protein [Actinacidiphila rubida]|uniref:DUF4331 domain-containing protein n=1 Tax=Actinacidiphila rubida TaxID=310780 RepID=A0A1H8SKV0_9ACTN|nr:DUF4331 family protein [Actinacidiphila rubida]SEO79187.1 protein of unknown function [Actinacidiphila rubida]